MGSKRRATGLMTSKERAALENLLIGPRVLRAAFLHEDPICLEWATRRSHDLAHAQTLEAAEGLVRAIAAERTRQIKRLDAVNIDSPRDMARIESKEAELAAQAKARAKASAPSLFDRRDGEWTTESHWRPVAGVDAPGGQIFHASITKEISS